jgi:hypothetical protein
MFLDGTTFGVEISCTWAPVILFLKKIENHISEFQKKRIRCSQLFIPQTCKKSCSNTLYSGLHKNDKRVDLSMYIFKSNFFIRILLFLCSPQFKEFRNKILHAYTLHN